MDKNRIESASVCSVYFFDYIWSEYDWSEISRNPDDWTAWDIGSALCLQQGVSVGSAVKCAQNGGSMCGHCESVLEQFGIAPGTCSVRIFGSGHINRTYLVSQENGEKLILQRINRSVFQKPEEVMENVVGVTRFLQEKIREAGGDPWRETLHVMETGLQ